MYKEFLKLIKFEDCTKSETKISEEEAMEMIKSLIKRQIQQHEGSPVTEEELQKSVKNAFRTGLTVLGMIHGAHYMGQGDSKQPLKPAQAQVQERSPAAARESVSSEHHDLYRKNPGSYKNKNIDSFLKAISMNESSGGINTNHERMENGIHAGDAAIGRYGLMPNTIKEMATRMGRENPLSIYSRMDNQKISQNIKKNPKHESQIANFMANHLHEKFGGDESKMAYSWNQGHNLQNDHFNDKHKDYKNHDYVQKYHKNRGSVEKGPSQKNQVNTGSVTSNQ